MRNKTGQMSRLRAAKQGIRPNEIQSSKLYDIKNNLNNPNLRGKINYIDLMDNAEKEHIRSELNTNLTKQERKRRVIKRPIGNFFYVVKNNGFDNYEFIGRYLIDDLFD